MSSSNGSFYYDTSDKQAGLAGNYIDGWYNDNQQQQHVNHQLLPENSLGTRNVNQPVSQYSNLFSSPHLSMSGSSFHSVGHDKNHASNNSSSMPQQSSRAYLRQNQMNLMRSENSSSPLNSPASTNCNFENEPPLLEELGIDPDQIFQKSLAVLNPLSSTDNVYLEDVDLAGPLAYITMFACFLLLAGKVHFSYIYGISVVGCLSMYALLNMMAISGVSVGMTISVLGYCFFPIVALAGVGILISLQGPLGILLTLVAVLWCSFSASAVFVTALNMDQQLTLIAYPCGILYSVFALLAFF